MTEPAPTPDPPERKPWLGRFLGFEVILNDRRRAPRVELPGLPEADSHRPLLAAEPPLKGVSS